MCLFLVVSGSLISIFGFLLCLIPWEIGIKRDRLYGGLLFLILRYSAALWDNDRVVARTNERVADGGLT